MKVKKRVHHRILKNLDVKILKFLWKWKLANFMTLKYALAFKRSLWKFYQVLRRLYKEHYIKEVSHSASSISFWTLTKKGFQYINDGSMGLTQARYQPQALLHDYWAMVFQFGDYVFELPRTVEILTEQELTAKELSDLPEWAPTTKEHIPDGLTKIENSYATRVVAFEVELSMKSDARYEEMIRYLDQKEEITWVLWLCANDKIIQKVTQKIVAVRRRRPLIHHFVLQKDVQKLGWSAPFLWGEMVGKTVYEILGQHPGQHAVNIPLTSHQPKAMSVFFETKKSPRQFSNLSSNVDPLAVLTP